MNRTQSTIAVVTIVVLFMCIGYLIITKDEPKENPRILELEAEKKQLKADMAAQFLMYISVSNEADSLLMALEIQSEKDSTANKIKHEIIRNDIVLLTDSESVDLLSINFRRKRVTHND